MSVTKPPTNLPNGRLPDARPTNESDLEALRARVRELEMLCAEVYVAAVELGLPQPLLNRLWTVAAQGSTPHAYHVDLPPRMPVPPTGPASVESITKRAQPAFARGATADKPPIPDIPLTDRPTSSDVRARAPQKELEPIAERRTVLVVDDDPMMLEVLVRILRRENFELLTAGNGAEALTIAESFDGKIDLLVTDYAMPQMKGRELAERLRARDPEIKVLYQTGFSDLLFEDRAELEEGAAFLEKPFTARGLREAARFSLFGSINPAS
jgi:CheY-like chemotaxis protein